MKITRTELLAENLIQQDIKTTQSDAKTQVIKDLAEFFITNSNAKDVCAKDVSTLYNFGEDFEMHKFSNCILSNCILENSLIKKQYNICKKICNQLNLEIENCSTSKNLTEKRSNNLSAIYDFNKNISEIELNAKIANKYFCGNVKMMQTYSNKMLEIEKKNYPIKYTEDDKNKEKITVAQSCRMNFSQNDTSDHLLKKIQEFDKDVSIGKDVAKKKVENKISEIYQKKYSEKQLFNTIVSFIKDFAERIGLSPERSIRHDIDILIQEHAKQNKKSKQDTLSHVSKVNNKRLQKENNKAQIMGL